MNKLILEDLLLILNKVLDEENKIEFIKKFQNQVWESKESSPEYEILRELAYDLDYYEPDPNLRHDDPAYYGEDKLLKEVKFALSRLYVIRNKNSKSTQI